MLPWTILYENKIAIVPSASFDLSSEIIALSLSLSRFPISAPSPRRQSLECKVKWECRDKSRSSPHSLLSTSALLWQCSVSCLLVCGGDDAVHRSALHCTLGWGPKIKMLDRQITLDPTGFILISAQTNHFVMIKVDFDERVLIRQILFLQNASWR